MKCPHCGQDTSDAKTCLNCGKVLAASQGVEVQYKDFKVSELLDIKLRKQAPAGQEVPEPAAGHEKQKAAPSAGRKKRVVVVIAVLAVATMAFFLLRLLIKY